MIYRFVSHSCLCLLIGALIAPHNADATPLTAYSTGTGANTATLVLDFAFFGGNAYTFQYSFDGSATSEDMLLALDAAGGLNLGYQYFDFGDGPSIFINGFSYLGNTATPGFEGAAGENWGLWTLDPTETQYTSAAVGPTNRDLQDGSIDGWALNVSPWNTQGFSATNDAPALPTSVPEPASAALLAIAGLVVTRRRRA